MGVVEEEADESVFWLEFLVDANLMREKRMHGSSDEGRQLPGIFAAGMTSKKNRKL